MKTTVFCFATILAASLTLGARPPSTGISGNYLEVRSCDIYTGACVANAEMNLAGREGMLVWNVREGTWNGVRLDGLSVIAVVSAESTLGDVSFEPRRGRAVLIVDRKADSLQREALRGFVQSQAANVIRDVVEIKTAPIEFELGGCKSGSCAKVKAGNLVEISTRCLGSKDHLCGNEENFYPPLTALHRAVSAYTEYATFTGRALNVTWTLTERRSAYLGAFAL